MAAVDTDNEFDFYLKFAKPLVLNLNDPGDRALAAAWINKLKDAGAGDPKLRVDYLKLLLFVLQRKKLVGVFSKNPNLIDKLELPATNLHDAAIEILKTEESLKILKGASNAGGDHPAYTAEYSADLLEYSAAQVIPNFGVQGYYAISIETLPNWNKVEKAILPRGAAAGAGDKEKSSSETSTVSTSSSEDAASPGDQSGDQSDDKPVVKPKDKSRSKSKEKSKDKDKSRDKSKPKRKSIDKEKSTPQPRGASNENVRFTSPTSRSGSETSKEPDHPPDAEVKETPKEKIGTAEAVRPISPRRTSESPSPPLSRKPPEDGESRKPPTWGSNLIGVTEPPVREFAAEEGSSAYPSLPYRTPSSPYSPQLPPGDRSVFFLESPPENLNSTPDASYASPYRPCPSSPRFSGSSGYPSLPYRTPSIPYSPQLPPGDRSLFFLESLPGNFDSTPDVSYASPYRPCPSRLRSPGSSGYPSLPYSTPPRYSAPLPPSSPCARPAPPVVIGGGEYDLQELQELGLNASDLGSDVLNMDDLADLNELDESEASPSFREDQILRRSIDDNLDAFDRLIAEYENEDLPYQSPCRPSPEQPPSPYRSPERAEAAPAKPPKKTITKKTVVKKKVPSKTVVKSEPPGSRQPSTSRLTTQRPPTSKTKVTTSTVKKVVTKPSASDLRNNAGAPTKIKTITTRSVTSRPASAQPTPLASSTQVAPPGTCPGAPSRIPGPGGSITKITKIESFSRIPAPGGSKIPGPGGLRPPGSSRIPAPGASRLPTSRTRIPNAESTRIAAPGTSRIPGKSGIPKRPGPPRPPQSLPYSPILPLGDADPFFLESPPQHLYDPTPPELSGSSGYPSLPYQTPPRPLNASGSSGYPSLPYRTPPERTPSPRQAAPISMYDMDQLKALGLDAADLEDIMVDFNDENVSEISVTSTVEYETPPELKIDDRDMDANLDEWDRRIAELEAENAEDIALYGSPQQAPKSPCGPQSPCASSPVRDQSVSPAAKSPAAHSRSEAQGSPVNMPRSPGTQTIVPLESSQRTPSEAHQASSVSGKPCYPSPDTQAIIDETERFTKEMLAAATAAEMDSFERLEDAYGANVDVAGALPPMPTTRADPRIAQVEADRQYKELVEKGALQDEYERHKKRQQQRRPDMPLTPPIFSKYRSVMGVEADRVYDPSEFGEFDDNIQWQSGGRALEGKTELSPRVDVRGSAAKRAQRQPDVDMFIGDEPEPDFMQQIDEEFEKSPAHERSPAPRRQNLSETQREIAGELSQIKQTTPAEGGLPLTTPQSAPSPRRSKKSIRVQGENGEISFELPSYESPKPDRLYWESPPKEYYMSPGADPLSPEKADALPAPYGLPKRVRFPPIKPVDMSHLRAKADMERAQSKAEQQRRMLESPPPLNPREQEDIDFYIKSPRRKELAQRAARLVADVPDTFVPKHQLRDWDLPQTGPEDVGVLEEGVPEFPATPPPCSPRRFQSPVQSSRSPSPGVCPGQQSPARSPRGPSPRQSPVQPSPKRSPFQYPPAQDDEYPSDFDLSGEAPPEDMQFSPPPRTPPESPPESPFALRNRLLQVGEPEYYSQEQMTIPMGGTSSRRRVMTRRSPAPDVQSIRELPPDFNEEHLPFIEKVGAGQGLKTRKPPKRMRVAAPPQEAILESPLRPPNLNEVDARSRVRHLTQPIYERYPDLAPEPPPEDLMGEAGPMVWQPSSELDRPVPGGLQSPLRLPPTVPGWSTPPHLKGQATRKPRAQVRLPTRGENVVVPSGLRDIIGQEMPPEDMAYSPPPLSPGELARHRRPSPSRKSPSPRATKFDQEGNANWPAPCQASSTRSKTSPKRQPTPLRPVALQDVTSPINLDDEALPDDMFYSPPSGTPPRTPESPPESPFTLRNRLLQAGEPEYYSQEQMTIPMGGTSSRRRVMTRRSPAPDVQSIRELPPDFNEEHLPFIEKVGAGQGLKTRKPPKRMRVAAPPQEVILESPLRPVNLNQADPASRVRHLTQPIYDRYTDLAPEPLPKDLMGEARPIDWQRPSELDRPVPEGLQSPLRLPTTVPGWSTPPHLKGQATRQPRAQVRLPTRGENVAVPSGLRDIIGQEIPPEDMAYSPPPLSPGESPCNVCPSPSSRRSPRQPSPKTVLFDQEDDVDLEAESPPPGLAKSPTRSPTSPRRQPSPVRPISLQDVTSPINLDDEALPDEMFYSPPSRTPPRSPDSPPESPFTLRNRLLQAGEPEYYSQEQMTIPMGGTSSRRRVMSRRSPAPDVQSIRELPPDFNEEHLPFIEKVGAGQGLKTRKPPKRMRVAAPPQEAILESPLRPLNLDQADPGSRVRHLTQPIYERYPDLAPEPLPEDLMGTAGYAQSSRSPTVFDRSIPDNLPAPIKPPTVVPGWTTPPHLRKAAKPRTPHEFKLIPPLRDVLFHEEPPPGWGYSPEGSPPCSPPRRSPVQRPLKTRSLTPPQQYMGPITRPSPYLSPRSPGTPPWKAGAVFDEDPQYLVLEMPPDDFMPAGSPEDWRPTRYVPQPASPNDTVDSFEAHEKSFAQSPLANLPCASPVRPRVSPRQQLQSMRSKVDSQYGQLRDTPPRRVPVAQPRSPDELAEFEALERLMTVDSPKRRSPCRIQNAPQIPMGVIDQQLGDLYETDKPWLKRIEHGVADIPDPHMPRRRPLVSSPCGWQSPEYSPILRAPRNDFQQIEEETAPEGVLDYSSPKSPPPPSQRPPSPQRQVMQPRNLFEELGDEDDYLDQAVLPAFRSPTSPPTPPRLEDHYNAPHTPPLSPESPDRLAEDVRTHQYTPHHYDKRRKLLSSTLQIKNRTVPSRHRPSKRPAVSPIREAPWEGARRDVPQGQFVSVDSDASEEVTEIEEVIEEYPNVGRPLLDRPIPMMGLPGGIADPGMHLISPPRAPRSTASSRSTYQPGPQRRKELTYESPPQFYQSPPRDIFGEPEVDIFEETPPFSPEDLYLGFSPPGGYGYEQSCPASRVSPNRSPTVCPGFAQSVKEHQYTNQLPWRDNIQPSSAVRCGSRRPSQRSARPQLAGIREASPERYELPMPNYYGSPGRTFVRTPNRRESVKEEPETIIEESITVIEEEPIPSDLDDSFIDENMSGFRWMG